MHSTFDLSQSTSISKSSSAFSIGSSCFLDALRFPDDMLKNSGKDEFTINETGVSQITRDRPGITVKYSGSGWGSNWMKAGRITAQPPCNRSHPLPGITDFPDTQLKV
jgi:hypothetical protein